MNLAELQKRTTRAEVSYRSAVQSYNEAKAEKKEADRSVSDSQEAQGIIQAVAQQVQQAAHDRIASVVSRCLEAVFDEPYEFRIEFERKRGRTEARLEFVRNGTAMDPMTASGGGVVDVAAFALRISSLMLARPPLRRLVVLDEPFKFVSEEYRENVKELLEQLAEEMGIQFLMVTHIRELECGKVVRL
jgi:DNA repair exonuclease SbcCD ATPase subunit